MERAKPSSFPSWHRGRPKELLSSLKPCFTSSLLQPATWWPWGSWRWWLRRAARRPTRCSRWRTPCTSRTCLCSAARAAPRARPASSTPAWRTRSTRWPRARPCASTTSCSSWSPSCAGRSSSSSTTATTVRAARRFRHRHVGIFSAGRWGGSGKGRVEYGVLGFSLTKCFEWTQVFVLKERLLWRLVPREGAKLLSNTYPDRQSLNLLTLLQWNINQVLTLISRGHIDVQGSSAWSLLVPENAFYQSWVSFSLQINFHSNYYFFYMLPHTILYLD